MSALKEAWQISAMLLLVALLVASQIEVARPRLPPPHRWDLMVVSAAVLLDFLFFVASGGILLVRWALAR